MNAEVVPVSELRQHLQAYLAHVQQGGRVRVTSHGKVIAEIVPPSPDATAADAARKRLRASVLRYDDPLAPSFDAAEWDMQR